MKTYLLIFLTLFIFSCNEKEPEGKFTVTGELKNAADQDIYLEELYFNENNPQVLDTAKLVKGKFTLSAVAKEEGLYRLRMQNDEAGFLFINDKSKIDFRTDLKDKSIAGTQFMTPANKLFKTFLIEVDTRLNTLETLLGESDSLHKVKAADSIIAFKTKQQDAAAASFKSYLIKMIDTVSDPVVAMFALGYTRGIDPAELKNSVAGLTKRFPAHNGVKTIIQKYNDAMTKKSEATQQPQGMAGKPAVGSIAPEISMADTSGKIFSLSSLRGKYVLIDFWASWCAPCRGENPNVVANYNKFKNKNFTILGVSLDEKRDAWIKAINQDKLVWKQVSDLKGWSSAAVPVYGFDGIPFNVLIDPQGKIIATDLREDALGKKLAEVLR